MEYKQVIIIDESLGMSKGKTAAQACHASLNSFLRSERPLRKEWNSKGAKKIILEKGNHSFEDVIKDAERLNIPYYKVNDAGHTELEPGTVTALGIGPAKSDKIDKLTSELKLIK